MRTNWLTRSIAMPGEEPNAASFYREVFWTSRHCRERWWSNVCQCGLEEETSLDGSPSRPLATVNLNPLQVPGQPLRCPHMYVKVLQLHLSGVSNTS